MSKLQRPYGTWQSSLTPRMVAEGLGFKDVQWAWDGKTLVWVESRSTGSVLVSKAGTQALRDLTDGSFSISGGVGYGGGAFTVKDNQVYFISRGRLYRTAIDGSEPKAITPKFGAAAAPRVSHDGRWVVFIHTYEHRDVLAVVDSNGQHWPQKLASGDDFVMQPAWHPDGRQIAYIAWNHPQMPWNGTELRLISLAHGGHGIPYAESEIAIVGDRKTAIFQPEFSPDGRYLSYVSDASNWTHLYLYDFETQEHRQITDGNVEHGIPAWVQGLRMYGWTGDSSAIYFLQHEHGFYSLWMYDLEHEATLRIHEFDLYPHLQQITVATQSEKVALIASAPTIATRIATYSPQDGLQIARRSSTESLSTEYLSPCKAIAWLGHDGDTVHGLYFAPKNPHYESSGHPPLMVLVHGGPTSQRPARYDPDVQFFTTRGFAVLQVNHRGSTGYGKAYMNKHRGHWGVYDVQDSITGAQHLVNEGLADPDRLVIMGGSAGGYTVLQTLIDAPGIFKAGICSYGITNHFLMSMESHKFEERYNDWLLGPLPEAASIYRDRSPIFHANKIQDALLIFQGTEDHVVPKNQSDALVAVLRRQGILHEYHVYEGEGHGFRKLETKIDFYNTVLKFLMQYVIYS